MARKIKGKWRGSKHYTCHDVTNVIDFRNNEHYTYICVLCENNNILWNISPKLP